MYWEYFGFEENPFSISPDPRYLYMSKRHQEALAHLFYGIGEGGGFVMLTGEVGTGKTTVCRSLIEQLPDTVDLAFVLNPRVNAIELLATICDEMGIPYAHGHETLKVLVDRLNEHLLDAHARGRRPVLIIDEAQNLAPDVLEQIRLLTNLETTKRKLLQIMLIGQPELNELLARPGLRQLDQRITARYHLRPLDPPETDAYIRHRLEVGGCHEPIFSARATRAIHRLSGGVPRLINSLCDRCLLGAYAEDRRRVDTRLVRGAAREVLGLPRRGPVRLIGAAAAAAVAALLFAAVDPLDLGVSALWRGGPRPVAAPAPTADLAEAVPDPTEPALEAAAPAAAGAGDDGSTATAALMTARAPLPPEPPGIRRRAPAPQPPRSQLPIDSPDMFEPPLAPAQEGGAAKDAPNAVAGLPPPLAPGEFGSIVPGTGVDDLVAAAGSAGPTPIELAIAPVEPIVGAAAPPPAPTPSLAAILREDGDGAGTESAVAALFAAWGHDYVELSGVTPCKKAQRAKLWCLQSTGDLAEIKRADLPAVLTLRTGEGRIRNVALLGIDDGAVRLNAGGTETTAATADLSRYWTGEFLLFWRAPREFSRVLKTGRRGPDVAWLRSALAGLGYDTGETADPAEYDGPLEEAVRRFQGARGLSVDGIAGPLTMIQVMHARGDGAAPTLH